MDEVSVNERERRAGWVAERDIDLLLLEEFYASAPFVGWWLAATGHEDHGEHALVAARQSVAEAEGESDLVVDLRCPRQGRLRLLIEDKVGADAQEAQADRYRQRGARYLARGACDAFEYCITAPAAYLASNPEATTYPARISYEDIRDHLRAVGDERSLHKATILQEAIDQQSRGYDKREVPAVTDFMRAYRAIATTDYPSLNANPPQVGSAKGGWVYFRPSRLPRGWDLVHKTGTGAVDLSIPGAGHRVTEVEECLEQIPGAESIIVAVTGKSASCRLLVDAIDKEASADEQAAGIRAALDAAAVLTSLAPSIERLWRTRS